MAHIADTSPVPFLPGRLGSSWQMTSSDTTLSPALQTTCPPQESAARFQQEAAPPRHLRYVHQASYTPQIALHRTTGLLWIDSGTLGVSLRSSGCPEAHH